MRIDEKYFVPFILIVAGVSALIIVFFTIHNRDSRQNSFAKQMMTHDSLKYKYMPVFEGHDSLSVQSFPKTYVIVDFWATWTASFTKKIHKQLHTLKQKYPKRIEILAAEVRDKPQNVRQYIHQHHYSFHYLNGSKVFNKFNVPGVPTQLVYAPGGKLQSIFTGSANQARMDSLQAMIGY